ncbi:unnamed protein product [Cochlearia groenlandica]
MPLTQILVPLILTFIPILLGSLISAGGIFVLGFFTPKESSTFELGSAGNRYVGIWHQRIRLNPVWVGNPTKPVLDSSGSLSIDTYGVLKITQASASPIIVNQRQAGQRSSLAANLSATLLDSGNFVVREIGPGGVTGRVLWQSFDYPTNVLLPGMKIGFNLRTNEEVSITSWRSDQVPVSGAFRLGLDPSGANQLLVWRHGEIYWSSGILTNNGSSQLTLELSRSYIDYDFNTSQITVTNVLRSNTSNQWISESSVPCNTDLKNSSAICITEEPTACRKESVYFEPRRGYMTNNAYYDGSLSSGVSDCHGSCWRNCSCIAFQSFSSGECQYWGKGSKFVPYDSFKQVIYVLDSVK